MEGGTRRQPQASSHGVAGFSRRVSSKRALEDLEEKWGIRLGVEKEWGPTFDKLLEYHNMPNDSLKDTTNFIAN